MTQLWQRLRPPLDMEQWAVVQAFAVVVTVPGLWIAFLVFVLHVR